MQKTEYQKMLAGELYNASDEEPMQMRVQARSLKQVYNQTAYDKAKREIL